MPLSDPLIVVIGVVLLGLIAGSIGKFVGKVMGGVSSFAGLVVVVWVLSKLLGFDLPYLP
jgi:hypothetical protein